MGFFDRLFGLRRDPSAGDGPSSYGSPRGGYGDRRGGVQDSVRGRRSPDEEAIARYRYLLETAPPERIEEAHAEAFARLTPEQRRQVLTELARSSGERVPDDSPRSLARAATRLEMRRPGSLMTAFGGGMGGGYGRGGLGMGGMGMGGMGLGGVLLTSVAASFVGSAIANEMFDHDGFMDWDTNGPGDAFADGGLDGGDDGPGGDGGGDLVADGGSAFGGDSGGFFDGGGDFGGDDFSF